MPEPIRISAKTLGALALPDFCPRCFWVQMRAEKLPYQIFPGIFSSVDSYSKRLVHSWFDRQAGRRPGWRRWARASVTSLRLTTRNSRPSTRKVRCC